MAFTFLNEKEIEELINGTNKYGSYDDNKYDIIKNKHLIEGAENLYKDADLDKIQYISKIAIAKTKIEKLKHQNNKLARSLINHNTAFLKIFIYDDYVESAIVIRIHVVDAHSKMLMSKHKKCMDRILFVNSPTNMIDHPIEFREIEPKY